MIVYRHLSRLLGGAFLVPLCFAFNACTQSSQGDFSVPSDVSKQIELLRDSGESLRKNSLFDQSIQVHTQELNLAKSVGDTISMVKALNNIGTNYRRLGLLEDASRNHLDALVLCMRSEDMEDHIVQKNRLMSLNGLGNVYLTMGNLEQADSIFREALEGEKRMDSKIGQAINLANIGSVKEKMGQTDSAWAYYRYSLAMNKQAQSKLGEALCFSHFASLHEKDGKFKEAADEYRHAYEVMVDSPDDWHKLEAGVNLAKLYIQMGKMDEVLQFLKEVDATATRIHSLDHRSRIRHLYYQYYMKKGDIHAALDNFILSTAYRDSLIDSKKVNQIQSMRINMERENNRAQLQVLDKRYQTELWIFKFITTILIVFLLVAVTIIVKQYKRMHQQT